MSRQDATTSEKVNSVILIYLTLFRMGLFGAAHGWGEGRAKRPPSLKSAKIHKSRDALPEFC